MSLNRIAEKYSPTGSVVARTIIKAVRNSSLDEWSLLLRETLQNSVDARVSTSRQVHFEVHLNEATAEQRKVLREDVFGEGIPPQLGLLSAALRHRNLPLLIIADWGTCGLGGPTKADLVTDDRTDFQDFFLNVGREETKSYKGGTFGLGRGVLFNISSAATIVVFTRTKAAGKPVVRLMGMSLSDTYNLAGHRYTGRHWWGIDSGGQPGPVTGVHAEQLARRLGLDVIPEDSTGTAILVVAPRMPKNGNEEAATLDETLDAMIRSAAIHGWPLMLSRHGRPAVRFRFGQGGEFWEPLGPDEPDSPVRHFVEAYRIAEAGVSPEQPTNWHYRDIHFRAGRSEPKVLGNLVFKHFPPAIAGSPEEDTDIPAEAIALMREPRLVVRYLPVAKHPAGSTTVGVFIADRTYDAVFAESEPVAHDDWIPAKIASAKNQRNPVKQALDKIRQAVKDSWGKLDFPNGGGAGPDGLAPVIGDLLGGLMADTQGFGPPPPPPPPPGPKTSAGSKTTRAIVKPPHLRPGKGEAVLAVFPVEVARVNSGTSVTLRAEAKVVLDRGLEGDDDRPEGAPTPAVVGWETTAGRLIDNRSRLIVDGSVSDLHVLVDQPIDTVITVEVSASEAAE